MGWGGVQKFGQCWFTKFLGLLFLEGICVCVWGGVLVEHLSMFFSHTYIDVTLDH